MEKKEILFSAREFLNKEGYDSYPSSIVAQVVKNSWEGRNKKIMVDYDISYNITSCSSVLSLDVWGLEDEDDYKNTLHKLNTIIDVTTEFRDSLVEERGRIKKK